MEILVIGSANGNTANLLAPNNCCKVRTERVGGRCLWRISCCVHAVKGDSRGVFVTFQMRSGRGILSFCHGSPASVDVAQLLIKLLSWKSDVRLALKPSFHVV